MFHINLCDIAFIQKFVKEYHVLPPSLWDPLPWPHLRQIQLSEARMYLITSLYITVLGYTYLHLDASTSFKRNGNSGIRTGRWKNPRINAQRATVLDKSLKDRHVVECGTPPHHTSQYHISTWNWSGCLDLDICWEQRIRNTPKAHICLAICEMCAKIVFLNEINA
jgi:hypothetical protein